MNSLVAMNDIVKDYPGVRALDGASLAVQEGEILGLLGENGAGKTTLMNVLAGLERPDSGEVRLAGETADFQSSRDAINAGIGMVHQSFMLVPQLTVAENVALSADESIWQLDLERIAQNLRELGAKYSFAVDPRAKVKDLSVGERQRAEILKVFSHDIRILILDEPTSALTPMEVEELFKSLTQMKKSGITVVFITHKLKEALTVSDRITILRAGRTVATVRPEDATANDLAALMVGMHVRAQEERAISPDASGRSALRLEGLRVRSDDDHLAVDGLNLTVEHGEILGVAGVQGNGQRELVESIVGVRALEAGRILIDGEEVTDWDPARLSSKGIAVIPEDRHRDGLAMNMSVGENLLARVYREAPYSRFGVLDLPTISQEADSVIEQMAIVCPSHHERVGNLSGGNQQKVILGRELILQDSKVILTAQPTLGLDVKAMVEVWDQLIKQRNNGAGIVLISPDLDEILGLSDRVGVLYRGRLVGLRSREEVTMPWLARRMAGIADEGTEEKDDFDSS